MSGVYPRFWATPIRYLQWSARERPAYFWSIVVGAIGPISIPITLKIREWAGDENAPKIPVTYPGMFSRGRIESYDEVEADIRFFLCSSDRSEETAVGV